MLIGRTTGSRCGSICEISADRTLTSGIGNILGFIADTRHPHGFDAIVKDDFAAVRGMLSRIADKP